MTRKRRTDAEWRELICACKSSGLSDNEWLKQNHISPSSFYNKLHKLYGEAETGTPLPEKNLTEIPETHEIVQLSFGDESRTLQNSGNASDAALFLHIGSYILEIRNHAEADAIRNTLLALRTLC